MNPRTNSFAQDAGLNPPELVGRTNIVKSEIFKLAISQNFLFKLATD
jgi:hypothetical protein